MVAWRDVKPGDPESVTGDEPYMIVHQEDAGEFSRRLHFLLPNGRRPVITIDAAADTPELRRNLGEALAANRRRYNPQRSRRQPS